jgi:hypothetical protein
VNKTTDNIEIKSCTQEKGNCDFGHPMLDHIANIEKGLTSNSGGTVQIIHSKKGAPMKPYKKWTGTVQDGIFYKWTGTGLTAIGSMKKWAEAVRTLPAKRRLLNKH